MRGGGGARVCPPGNAKAICFLSNTGPEKDMFICFLCNPGPENDKAICCRPENDKLYIYLGKPVLTSWKITRPPRPAFNVEL